jgi:hypothetical protein
VTLDDKPATGFFINWVTIVAVVRLDIPAIGDRVLFFCPYGDAVTLELIPTTGFLVNWTTGDKVTLELILATGVGLPLF